MLFSCIEGGDLVFFGQFESQFDDASILKGQPMDITTQPGFVCALERVHRLCRLHGKVDGPGNDVQETPKIIKGKDFEEARIFFAKLRQNLPGE